MAVDDTPPPPNTTDKIIPFSIPNKVPIKLDLEKHNYNSWSSFSLIHLGSLGLKSHVETDTASTNPEWCQLDDLIKMWILSSLCDSLQEQVVTTPGNAKALWDHLKDLFHDNKDARALNLDNELRSIKIGKMTVNEYCTKIRSIADRLKNLGCVVSDKNLVIYTVNGLDSRFATLVEIIRHRETFPSFENVRTMLLLKESFFNDDSGSSTDFASSSSSPTVLLASNPSNNKGNPNKPSNLPQLCNHINKGTCSRAHHCNPSRTPVDTESKLGPDGVPVQDPTLYRSLAEGLQYLTFTRPDLSYAVQQICLYMHDPREPYFAALKRILRYVRGTLDFGFHLYASATTSLVGYTDADWAGCPTTRRPTSGYCVFLGDNLLSWSFKRQHTISRSSAEAEYQGVANVVAETAWLRNLLRELHSPLTTATLVYCDNVSAVFPDIFTKELPSALFEDFGSSLSVRAPPAPTVGACHTLTLSNDEKQKTIEKLLTDNRGKDGEFSKVREGAYSEATKLQKRRKQASLYWPREEYEIYARFKDEGNRECMKDGASWSSHYAVMEVRMAMIEGVCSQLSDALLSWFLVVSNEDAAVGYNKRLMVRKCNLVW
ncbi:hybrid signal transduction histidine kinase M [Tanacetum coccineum]